jgi:uncharacterized protein (TIGR00725 family)
MDRSQSRYVSVIGQGVCDVEMTALGEELGELLAQRGTTVVCGGMGGVMAAVAKGVKRAGGVCIGVLPKLDRSSADPDLTYSICTGVGHARNLAVVASGDVVIALGGQWGTLSEIGLARSIGKCVILLHSWGLTPNERELDGVTRAQTPADAVELALGRGPDAALASP